MEKRGHSTIRVRLTAIVLIFTVLLLIVFSVMTYSLFYAEQRRSVLQSTEFNLQLAAGVSSRSFEYINAFMTWCMGSSDITPYMRGTSTRGTSAYNALNEQLLTNPSYRFINRMIVFDGKTKLLQVGSRVTNDTAVPLFTAYIKLAELTDRTSGTAMYYGVDAISSAAVKSILIMRTFPVTASQQGLVYAAIDPDVITEPITNYSVAAGDALYLDTGAALYRLDNGSFDEMPAGFYTYGESLDEALYANTKMREAQSADGGERCAAISYPLENTNGWYLMHVMSPARFGITSGKYMVVILITALLVLLLGLGLLLYLSRTISAPVEKLRERLLKISGGDFSKDGGIEWQNELGDVGRGINSLSQSVQELMDTRVENEKEKKDLEYQMLQNQVNPHFIYNTLNSIKWMATIQNATGIAEMTTAFSHLLKSVAKGSETLITLQEEFALLNDYCTIQQYRYGGSITLDIADISDESLCRCLIPRFTLQPLAENAIFHGIEPKGGVGSIWLHISEENGDLRIVMEDDGVGMSAETIHKIFTQPEDNRKKKYKQIGVRNVHRRIQYAFGEKYGLAAESEEGKYTRMIITIPMIYEKTQLADADSTAREAGAKSGKKEGAQNV